MRYADYSGHWELNPFPGCNQLVVSNHAYVLPKHRGKGLGTRKNEARLNQAAELGYDYILCTCLTTNTAQIAVLTRNGWEVLTNFHNSVTNSDVQLWGKKLPVPNERCQDGCGCCACIHK